MLVIRCQNREYHVLVCLQIFYFPKTTWNFARDSCQCHPVSVRPLSLCHSHPHFLQFLRFLQSTYVSSIPINFVFLYLNCSLPSFSTWVISQSWILEYHRTSTTRSHTSGFGVYSLSILFIFFFFSFLRSVGYVDRNLSLNWVVIFLSSGLFIWKIVAFMFSCISKASSLSF